MERAELEQMTAELTRRARQQAAVAELSQRALAGEALSTLMNEAVIMSARILEVEYSNVLELLPDGRNLILRAAVGCQEGMVGKATVDACSDPHIGCTLVSNEPVIIEDFDAEKRCDGSPWPREPAIASGMSVVIAGRDGPFGILGARTAQRRAFAGDEAHFIQSIANVLALAVERKKAEEAFRESDQKYKDMAESLPQIVFETDAKGNISYANRVAFETFGYTRQDLAEGVNAIQMLSPEERDRALQKMQAVLAGENTGNIEYTALKKDGSTFQVLIHSVPVIRDGEAVGIRGVIVDISERKRLEQQFFQAQKMEAIGRLAGGVAHDFNNLLTVIIGCSDLLLEGRSAEDRDRRDIEQIRKAGQQAASLAAQLLAFSRKQIRAPQVLQLNSVVTHLEKMLRRLIGEDIEIVMRLDPGLNHTKADPGQLQQVIMNLAVNARDAMPDGGRITIETANVDLDETYARQHMPVEPGSYTMLAVKDTGCGMTPEVQSHLFEPFFTTKELGKGTGLGLSSVYGIVKQNGGHICVESEPGRGSTFRIFLPHIQEAEASDGPERARKRVPPGAETILLVEDDEGLREMSRRILEHHGYKVLTAAKTPEAAAIFESSQIPIHLLLTDVVMPGESGAALARRLTKRRPDLKVVYTSGYANKAALADGTPDAGIVFLPKPFTPDELACKVREALETGSRTIPQLQGVGSGEVH